MSDATLIIEVQVGGQTLRLPKEDALVLWAELDDVFSGEEEPEPQAPQPAPVYVPWQPWYSWPNQLWIEPWVQTSPNITLATGGTVAAGWKLSDQGGNTCSNVRLFWDGAAQELKAVTR